MRLNFSVIVIVFHATCFADPTVGLIAHDESASLLGYTFFSPMSSYHSYIIDMDGELVHSWEHDTIPGNASYLLPNGDILRTGNDQLYSDISGGGQGGIVTRQTWDGDEVWTYELNNSKYRLHHDIEPMPNGHVLMIAWQYRSDDEAYAAGREDGTLSDPDPQLWSDSVIEVDPNAKGGPAIVWQWDVWNHLVQDLYRDRDNYEDDVSEHPGRIDINNYVDYRADWLHLNAIDYNAELDQILLSCPKFREIWIIDHSTTTEEAGTSKGGDSEKGGELLYRWGNPQAWGNGTTSDQQLFAQHGVNWIAEGFEGAGEILIFNNGVGRPVPPWESFSSVETLTPPLNKAGTYDMKVDGSWGPDSMTMVYTADDPTDLYAEFLSGAQRLTNGNTLICDGSHGRFFEIDEDMTIVWDYINPVITDGVLTQCDAIPGEGTPMQDNASFRVLRYTPSYPAFDGKDLTPMGPIEGLYPGDYTGDATVNISDILAIIEGWGDSYDVSDILSVIENWGGGCS